ncbi:hypothetical protein [Kangiella koreensis]|nr:hypothetical protein [Kangiella koreensis]
MKIRHLKYLSILFFAPLVACSDAHNGNHSETTDKPMADYQQQIEAAIADKSCSTNDDCALVEIGAKPCGGPETYEPYSKPNVDEVKLQKIAATYKKERQDYFKENQIMGICVVTPKPHVSCVNNQCVASKQNLQVQ